LRSKDFKIGGSRVHFNLVLDSFETLLDGLLHFEAARFGKHFARPILAIASIFSSLHYTITEDQVQLFPASFLPTSLGKSQSTFPSFLLGDES
jgi:hypothetical protein